MADKSPIIDEAGVTGGLVKNSLLQAMIERIPYVLGLTEVLSDLTQASGLIYRVIHWQKTGYAYYYDPNDTTTPDDGETVIVDFDGHRYHLAASSDITVNSVLAIQNAPPGSPVVGDAYVVGTSPTGAWVGHANDIAIWLLSGWVFAEPKVGHTLLNQATDGNIQFGDTGAWGGFAVSFANGSIANGAIEFAMGIAVETTQNSPPGSPAQNLFYIVGNSPTGAWAGHAKAVTEWNGSAWVFYTPYVGATVYHKGNAALTNYIASGVWSSATSSQVFDFTTPGAATWNKPPFGTTALIQVWGAGGSGGRNNGSNGAGGGGGGSYVERTMPLAELASSVSVTVGAGGASITSGATDGNVGGNSSFGSHVTAYGGGGGDTAGGAGGGAGQTGPGSAGPSGTAGGAGGSPMGGVGAATGSPDTNAADSLLGGGGGGFPSSVSSGPRTGASSIGGGGGGGAGGSGSTQGNGGSSLRGGGGGGGGGATTTGGTSTGGGNGGAGAGGSTNATAGAQPGGGGGGSRTGNSGKGGDGMVRVTVY